MVLAGCLSSPSTTPADGGGDAVVMPGVDGGGSRDARTTSGDVGTTRDAGGGPETATGQDATAIVEGGRAADGGASRCAMTSTAVTCPSQQHTESTASGARVVYYQVPLGAAPAAGWPVVINFQATDVGPTYAFVASTSDAYAAFGIYYEAELTKNLLDAGYAVLAPEAITTDGTSFWETNISPYATSWSGSPDDELVQKMLTDIAAGVFGPLDESSLYATGLSSGGYMTSRMALSYPGKFKALAIESASWATCLSGGGPSGSGMCTVPSTLPAMHPPTLLLHGTLDTTIIPEWTVTAYVTALTASGVPEKEVDDANGGHQWIPEAPSAVLAWFQKYP